MSNFKAGAASIVINLGDDCFPNAESVIKHDDVYVRTVIFETDRRFAILSADMPSMFPADIRHCKKLLQEMAGVAPEDSWVTVSHSFSSPHAWPKGDAEQKDTLRPKGLDDHPELAEPTARVTAAYQEAYQKSIEVALDNMRDATIGYGVGSCAINANRHMYTVDGWWQGLNHEGFVDRTLNVVRINDMSGEPIAILYNYSVQVGAAAGEFPEFDNGRVTSSDLVGAASLYIEKEYGGNCTAMFLCGGTGDQTSLYKINYIENDKNGKFRKCSLGMAGFAIVEAQGNLLGNAVVQTAQQIKCEENAPKIRTARKNYVCDCQKRDADMKKLRPTHSYNFIPDGTRNMTVDAMVIGDIALLGLLPEMDAFTLAQIREKSPYEKTVIATFVNGNAKSMPQEESYDLLHYTALNSPFVKGSAERTRDVAVELLNEVKNA